MDIKCTEKELFILNKVSHAAQELGMESYLIGGFVRDKIIGRKTKDADIVCVGDGIELAKAVAKKFKPEPKFSYFKNFGTAHLRLNFFRHKDSSKVSSSGGDLEETFDLEFVGARKESYRYHSRKPDV